MNHTEEFNRIMAAQQRPKKAKQAPVKVEYVGEREYMNAMQTDLAKCTIAGNVVSLPFERLPNYDQIRTALLNAGATYKRSTFIFPNDARPYIDRLMGGESVNIKKEFQYFPTPAKLADELVRLADIQPGHMVLEPSAGQGAIINAIQRACPTFGKDGADLIHFFELMPENAEITKHIPGTIFLGHDFLTTPDPNHAFIGTWHRVVANPPFNKNQDIDHIRAMYAGLKKGGRIVTIASNSWRTGSQKKQVMFREWLDDIGAVIEDVGAGEFKESGTGIATCIVIIDK